MARSTPNSPRPAPAPPALCRTTQRSQATRGTSRRRLAPVSIATTPSCTIPLTRGSREPTARPSRPTWSTTRASVPAASRTSSRLPRLLAADGLGSGADRAVHLTAGVARGDCLSLVVLTLALAESNLELDPVALPVEAQRNQGQPLLLDGDPQADDLRLVQEQLSLAFRLVIGAVAPFVGADVDVDQERLAPTEADVSLAEVGAALSQRFDFGAAELEAGFNSLQDEVVMEGRPVAGDGGIGIALLLPHYRRPRSHAAALIGRPPAGWTSVTT